ncbi:hypothetical protein SLEP1_g27567 [Rubroshorea leprosula]|uniref:Reverse transcriptase/retrotransposon-derived protein RNase H-like domain-containing protein n=1 Tax=Rubroshorea leprosula TaxID=152421 RepID=A0AAV5JTJ8_9ROSI|nr:hypothetical protein SLEP1_g27567 [Rubroshorea leprosula]
MPVDKNRPLKQPFEEAEWENRPITFSPTDYKRTGVEPDVVMPDADPFVATVRIGNHNVNKVFIDTGTELWFRMASISFLMVKMESAYNAIIRKATHCELKAIISQPHLSMKFPTPQGIRAMSISNIDHRPENVEQKAEPVELVKTVPLNPNDPEKTVKIGTKLTKKEREKLLEFLKANQDVFAWITDEMPRIPAKLEVHKLSTDSTRRPVKPNGKWRMCIGFTNLNEACLKDPHPLPNVEKLVEQAAGHERMSFLDASSGYHQVQLWLDDQEKTAFYARDAIYYYVMMPFGLKNVAEDHIDDLKENISKPTPSADEVKPIEMYICCGIGQIPKWTNECQQAFDELKQYLASPPLLSKPVEGEKLYLFLGITEEALSSVLLREQDKHQKPICYISKVLQGAERNYPITEKATFALVCTARKLRAYLQSHEIVVYTDLPLKKILQKLELFSWLIGWVVELNGAASVEGSGAGTMLIGPNGFKSEHALRFNFKTTNNAVEYEALIYGLKDPQLSHYASVVSRMKASFISFQIDKIPKADNRRVDELSKLASSQDINPHRATVVEILDAPSYTNLKDECLILSTDPSSPS